METESKVDRVWIEIKRKERTIYPSNIVKSKKKKKEKEKRSWKAVYPSQKFPRVQSDRVENFPRREFPLGTLGARHVKGSFSP